MKSLAFPSAKIAPSGESIRSSSAALDRATRLAGTRCIAMALHSYTGHGPGQTFIEVVNGMQVAGVDVRAFLPRLRVSPAGQASFRSTIPLPLCRLPWKWVRGIGARTTEHAILSALKGADPTHTAVFSFPDMSLKTAKCVRDRGYALVRELTNLHRGTARRIIRAEHEAEDLAPFEDITLESVEQEIENLKLATHIIAPNPHVRLSLIEHNVPSEDIFDASYGWSRKRFQNRGLRAKRAPGERIAIFVGRVSYQKGAHLLLRAWHKAGCPGKLVLAGAIEDQLKARLGNLLAHPSIEKLGYLQDVGAAYAAADYFIFPSLVEGGPQVTYEAAAYGLPLILSPMGAGRFTEDNGAGHIMDPHDVDQMAAAISDFAVRSDLGDLGEHAAKWADAFEWSVIGPDRANIVALAVAQRAAQLGSR